MKSLRTARLVATLLLSLQGYALARAAGPQTVACHCSEHCGCAMHDAPASADDSKLPPCHRKAKHHSDGPGVRAGCEMPQPALTMCFWLGLPDPGAVGVEERGRDVLHSVSGPPEAPAIDAVRRPPKAIV